MHYKSVTLVYVCIVECSDVPIYTEIMSFDISSQVDIICQNLTNYHIPRISFVIQWEF